MMNTPRPLVVIGLLGPTLDAGHDQKRWNRWRPSVSLHMQTDFIVQRFELLHQRRYDNLARQISDDIAQVSPHTTVTSRHIEFKDPWDFAAVYTSLHQFARSYPWDTDRDDYLIHITTGTHVAQICLFLLTESRHIPARLIQTSPVQKERGPKDAQGTHTIIDLDLKKYDSIAARFADDAKNAATFLTAGIETRNPTFAALLARVERVAAASHAPILLGGPTGAGKTVLARRIYELKKSRHLVTGPLVELNCATMRGDHAMSALFGHRKGAFTGALSDRDGLLKRADGGVLFLDEIGELGRDEQAMLLRALEDKTFIPVGADKPVLSDFQLIAGTNRDLSSDVQRGSFREDLLARINLWTFTLPSLSERREDIEPNIDYELEQFSRDTGKRVSFNAEARTRFLRFATDSSAIWSANFRDLRAAVIRLATLADGGRIDERLVAEEEKRLRQLWHPTQTTTVDDVAQVLGSRSDQFDEFDLVQLTHVLRVCRQARSLSDAGRRLFSVSRAKRSKTNDADRLKKYLQRFGLTWDDCHPE
jgi:transcriptional regulatory protein RtcR